jgi:hypothetical protein
MEKTITRPILGSSESAHTNVALSKRTNQLASSSDPKQVLIGTEKN